MRAVLGSPSLVLVPLLVGSAVAAQEAGPQRHRDAVREAKAYVAGLGPSKRCPVTIDADPERAVGVVIRPHQSSFFLFVPQEGLDKTDFAGEAIGRGHGVPVGYLFPMWTPEVDGQRIDVERRAALYKRMLHSVYEDPKAGKLILDCLALTARRQEDGGYVLHAFGDGEEPLFTVPLEKGGKPGTSVAARALDVKDLRVKLEFSFGDGRRASVPFGAPPRP